jgi:pectin methylesterase-like acyl-CoA thioesterase
MFSARFWAPLFLCCAVLIASSSQSVSAATLCVNPAGSHGCYTTISAAVSHAAAFDVINVGPGTYKEDVVIGMPLSLIGAGAGASIIDATGLPTVSLSTDSITRVSTTSTSQDSRSRMRIGKEFLSSALRMW